MLYTSRTSQNLTRWCAIAFLLITLSAITSCQRSQTDPLQVGVAITDITPEIGDSHYSGVSTGVNDPLFAKALVFEQGDIQGALLICDILIIPRDLSRIVRENASRKTGIPFQYISIASTHTHTGPSIRESVKEYAAREAAGELTKEDKEGYIAYLISGMTESIVRAKEQLQEVELTTGIGHAPGISFNRRFLMTDGRVRTNAGRMNPKIVYPVAPADPDVHFVLFSPVSEKNFSASLTVFASHYARGGTEYSADYPYYLQNSLKEIFGEQIISVFGAGTCGDINTIDVSRSDPDAREGMEWVETVGHTIAEAIEEALPSGKKIRPWLGVDSRTIFLPLQDYTREELRWAKEGTGQLYHERSGMISRYRGKILELEEMRQRDAISPSVSGDPWRLPVEIHAFRLDAQTAIITIPGEVFVELGLDLKKRSPFANTMVIELANLDIRYVPTERAFAEGDYESIHSRLAPGSGEKMVEEALEMLNELKNSAL